MSKKEEVLLWSWLLVATILFGIILGFVVAKVSPDVEEETTTEIIMEDIKLLKSKTPVV